MRRFVSDLMSGRCECGAAFTLLSWPERSSHHETNLRVRHLLCLDCGYRTRLIKSGKPIFSRDQIAEIVRLYTEEELMSSEIADRVHCCASTVRAYIRDEGIPLRTRPENAKILAKRRRENSLEEEDIATIEWLYWGLGMSSAQIGYRLDVAPSCIRGRMRRHGIPRRSRSEANRRAWRERKQSPGYKEWVKKVGEQKRREWEEGKITFGAEKVAA